MTRWWRWVEWWREVQAVKGRGMKDDGRIMQEEEGGRKREGRWERKV